MKYIYTYTIFILLSSFVPLLQAEEITLNGLALRVDRLEKITQRIESLLTHHSEEFQSLTESNKPQNRTLYVFLESQNPALFHTFIQYLESNIPNLKVKRIASLKDIAHEKEPIVLYVLQHAGNRWEGFYKSEQIAECTQATNHHCAVTVVALAGANAGSIQGPGNRSAGSNLVPPIDELIFKHNITGVFHSPDKDDQNRKSLEALKKIITSERYSY